MSDGDGRGEVFPKTNAWLGEMTGLAVREPGDDADGPILELHGERGVAAVEIVEMDESAGGLEDAGEELRRHFDV